MQQSEQRLSPRVGPSLGMAFRFECQRHASNCSRRSTVVDVMADAWFDVLGYDEQSWAELIGSATTLAQAIDLCQERVRAWCEESQRHPIVSGPTVGPVLGMCYRRQLVQHARSGNIPARLEEVESLGNAEWSKVLDGCDTEAWAAFNLGGYLQERRRARRALVQSSVDLSD